MKVKIKKINSKSTLPKMIRDGDVCFDCYANVSTTVYVGERDLIPLGFALELPNNYEAVIRPRSGLSKKGIDVTIGTCDSNFRGELMACVINNSNEDFVVHIGDRICQLAIREVPQIEFEEVEELSETNRGSNGFGSSGI